MDIENAHAQTVTIRENTNEGDKMTWIDVLKHGLENDSREDREIIAEFDKLHNRFMEWSKRVTPNSKTSGGMKSKQHEKYQLLGADILAKLGVASKEYSNLIRENISDSPRRTVMNEPFAPPMGKSITKANKRDWDLEAVQKLTRDNHGLYRMGHTEIESLNNYLNNLIKDGGKYDRDDEEYSEIAQLSQKLEVTMDNLEDYLIEAQRLLQDIGL
mgnify:CR=1 FL=1